MTTRTQTSSKTSERYVKKTKTPKTDVFNVAGHCNQPHVQPRPMSDNLAPGRVRLIRLHEKKWVNHTVLHYCFLDSPSHWRGSAADKDAARRAFQEWKDLPIGLDFVEVFDPQEAEIRIGFFHHPTAQDAGSWSYLGRDSVDLVPDPAQRTMNFGWALTDQYGYDTALHEIGHAMGFPHEHQNPLAGIEWDEQAALSYYAGSPNFWTEEQTRRNVLNKLSLAEIDGSDWDPNSIMHYHVRQGLILNPPEFRDTPLIPAPGLSETDKETAKHFYPAAEGPRLPELRPFEAHQVRIEPGQQLDFVIKPTLSRTYTIQTFGPLDTVMVLFEEIDGEPRYLNADDDSGFNYNAKLKERLMRGRTYFVRLRLYYTGASGEGAILMY